MPDPLLKAIYDVKYLLTSMNRDAGAKSVRLDIMLRCFNELEKLIVEERIRADYHRRHEQQESLPTRSN